MLPLLATCLAVLGLANAQNFVVFDSTAYTNTSIGFGTSPINWIPAYVCNPLVADGAAPSRPDWQRIVAQWNVHPGYPLVLDCENIYLGSAATADANLATMQKLQTWAAEVLPAGQIIGWYGLAGNTPASLFGHYRALIANHSSHAFFPSAYTFSSSLDAWQKSLSTVLAQIKVINDSLPTFPFVWPQYHNSPFSFYPVSLWQNQLLGLKKNSDVDGFVIWGGKNHAVCNDACQAIAGAQPWLNATRSFLNELYGIYNQSPQRSGRQVFVGV
ncbi:hypothetical protein IF1G_09081 [Cordyceps javanica]|uniref:Uncharacterized protein n=1 Tax=Cordyceps javanica TaxID=43265 RepID=A0A545VRB1_9HYPO|nr:hypothetical protein IF1G_09081 [Cordyceps javanica]TQW04205.1 hypothetical protein IF2G_08519 [Cordyceps javanica]